MEIPPQGITPGDLDKIKIFDEDGDLVARLGMLVTLYFEEPYDKKLRLAVAQCIEEYYAMVKSQLKWVGSEKLGTHKLSNYTLPPVAELIQPLDEDSIFELVMTGSERLIEASPYNIDTLLTRKWRYKKNRLYVRYLADGISGTAGSRLLSGVGARLVPKDVALPWLCRVSRYSQRG